MGRLTARLRGRMEPLPPVQAQPEPKDAESANERGLGNTAQAPPLVSSYSGCYRVPTGSRHAFTAPESSSASTSAES